MSFWNSHEEIWKQLAEELHGQFVDGGWFSHGKVEARWENWTITMDKHVASNGKSQHTRIRAPYVNADGFRFRIYRTGFFTGLGKAFGVQDIETGDEPFDRGFVIQGNSEDKVLAMLRRPELRRLIEAQPDICFEVKDDEGWFVATFPEGVDELHFLADGVIKDIEQLRNLYKLFCEVLDYLVSVGSAYGQEPGVTLK